MKSKDLQKLVLSKYETGQTLKEIFENLKSAVSHQIVGRWRQMIQEIGTIDLSKPSACHRTVRMKALIHKIKRESKDFLQKIGT